MKRILALLYIIPLLLAGCSKSLDLYPLDAISDATYWRSASDFKTAANSIYPSLSAHGIRSDVESDIAFNFPNSVSNGTYNVTETDNNWNNPYWYIRMCNKIIESAANSDIQDDPGVKRFVAEAKFFRAWNYWLLYRSYGGVPLIKEVLDFDTPALYDPRASRKEIVDFILQDLLESSSDLPMKSDLSSEDDGRITNGAALALRARVALFEGTWNTYHNSGDANVYLDIAIQASSSVIASEEYSLYNGLGEESYWGLFVEEGDDSPEGILDDRYELNVREHYIPILVHDQPCYLPTKKLADMYLCNDGLPINKSPLFLGYDTWTSEFENRDPRMSLTILPPGSIKAQNLYPDPIESWPFFPQRNGNTGYIINKYRSESEYGTTTQRYDFDLRVIRYAEILLIYAEATFERNGSISDGDLDKSVNVVRARVGMTPMTNAFISSNDMDIKEEIRRERTIELALEGFRYDDLRRWKTAEDELPKAIKGIKITDSQWGTDPIIINDADKNPYTTEEYQNRLDENGFLIVEEAVKRSFNPSKHYLRPLPTKEISINENLKQNPNW